MKVIVKDKSWDFSKEKYFWKPCSAGLNENYLLKTLTRNVSEKYRLKVNGTTPITRHMNRNRLPNPPVFRGRKHVEVIAQNHRQNIWRIYFRVVKKDWISTVSATRHRPLNLIYYRSDTAPTDTKGIHTKDVISWKQWARQPNKCIVQHTRKSLFV